MRVTLKSIPNRLYGPSSFIKLKSQLLTSHCTQFNSITHMRHQQHVRNQIRKYKDRDIIHGYSTMTESMCTIKGNSSETISKALLCLKQIEHKT